MLGGHQAGDVGGQRVETGSESQADALERIGHSQKTAPQHIPDISYLVRWRSHQPRPTSRRDRGKTHAPQWIWRLEVHSRDRLN